MQVGHHAFDDLKLLVVFLAKDGDIRLHNVKQPRHHGGHTAEVAGAHLAVQHIGQAGGLHDGFIAGGIHGLHLRQEHHSDTGLFEQGKVAFHIARIGVQIGGFAKLGGIHENRHGNGVGVGFCGFDKAHVACVQVSHGGHHADALAILAQPCDRLAAFRN